MNRLLVRRKLGFNTSGKLRHHSLRAADDGWRAQRDILNLKFCYISQSCGGLKFSICATDDTTSAQIFYFDEKIYS